MISILVVSTGDCNLSCCIMEGQIDLARLESQSFALPVYLTDTVRHTPRRNISSGTCCHTLAQLGLASVRLYYTAPYNWYRCFVHLSSYTSNGYRTTYASPKVRPPVSAVIYSLGLGTAGFGLVSI